MVGAGFTFLDTSTLSDQKIKQELINYFNLMHFVIKVCKRTNNQYV